MGAPFSAALPLDLPSMPKPEREIVFGSVCSGIEAASVAWRPLGWRCAFVAEIDPFPCHVLHERYGCGRPRAMPAPDDAPKAKEKRRRIAAIKAVSKLPEEPTEGAPANAGDFTTIEAGQHEPIDVLIGGTPCQDFSIAGLRAGIAGERGNLTLEFLRLAERLRPEWLVWENVPGVLSSDKGRALGAFLGGLAELGYGFAYRVLDAQHFGLAQRRERVFVVGHLGDWRRAASVLFERESLSGHPAPSREKASSVAGTIGGTSPGGGWRIGADEAAANQLVALTPGDRGLSVDQACGGMAIPVAFGISSDCFDRSGEGASGAPGDRAGLGISQEVSPALRARRPNAVARTLNAHGGPHGRLDVSTETFIATTLRARDGARGVDSDCTDTLIPIGFNSRQDPAVTGRVAWSLGAASPQAQAIGHRAGVRRLTPIECERLQGFPDGWTDVPYRGKPAADGPRYSALGNSMAVHVISWFGRRIELVMSLSDEAASHTPAVAAE